ncbi:MAG: peptide-methionine (S)-S-oxide reductase MsrA [Acidobacteriota bacterium]
MSASEQITLGGGCFWCIEAVFDELRGVTRVESGYAGGQLANPTYREVCDGDTGHTEVVRVTFDPAEISLADLLGVFFVAHDPTTLNRQGADAGTQYRSAIYYLNAEQKQTAEAVMREVASSALWGKAPLTTELAPLGDFYPAEDYHRDYYRNNPNQGYCRAVIEPKVAKVRKEFRDRLKRA